ncbi:hypothetical protein D4764_21G0005330 [Takifugu flavidus]|uniref:Uncharacterized protein n=1 Tax=Takifugu flavidus TaxID=433684 RepID=A0A5C6NEN0_9TELE|nr:hypothetical protein D4764_21G0005330 [Takifugu flavidus]
MNGMLETRATSGGRQLEQGGGVGEGVATEGRRILSDLSVPPLSSQCLRRKERGFGSRVPQQTGICSCGKKEARHKPADVQSFREDVATQMRFPVSAPTDEDAKAPSCSPLATRRCLLRGGVREPNASPSAAMLGSEAEMAAVPSRGHEGNGSARISQLQVIQMKC